MQLWRGEIIGRTWRSLPREVGRGAYNGHLHRSRDPDGNHICRSAVLRTYSSIVSLRHYVDRRIAHMEFEMDLRVGRQEAIPYRHDHRRRDQMARCINSQTTHRTQPFLVQILQRTGDLIDCRPKLVEQALRLHRWPIHCASCGAANAPRDAPQADASSG